VASVGLVKIDIVATTGKLIKPIQGARRALRSLHGSAGVAAQGLQKIGGGLKRLAGPLLALGASAAGLFTLAKGISAVMKAFGTGDEMQKFADSIGIEADALAGLEVASNRTGAGVEKLRNGLRRMVNAVSESATGTGQAVRTFEALGLSAEALNRMTPDEQFRAIADAFDRVSNTSDKVQYAMDIFGRTGVDLVNTMRGGSEALDGFAAEAERLGLTLGDDRRKLEAANDAMDRIKDAIKGIAGQIAVRLAPFVEWLSTKLLDAGTQGTSFGTKVARGMELATEAIGYVLDAVDAIRDGFAYAQYGIEWFTVQAAKGLAWVVEQIETFAETITQVIPWAFAQAQRFVQQSLADMVQALANVVQWLDSKLPERFRTGLGQMAQDYAATLQDVIDQQPDINIDDYGVDMTFGETATEFANAMQDGLDASKQELDKFLSRENLSDKFSYAVGEIVAKTNETVAKAAGEILPDPSEEAAGGRMQDLQVGALERGSAAAMSAIFGTQDKDKQLEEAEKQTRLLKQISSPQYLIGMASITW